MKIVQSYWSLPSQSSQLVDGRDNGGWLHKRYHYLSMALSCLLLRRFYDDVELITDSAGKSILIDLLKLPYTKVYTDLDQFSEYPPILWALPKLYAYSVQDSPFLHVDGDVFIWEAFDPVLTSAAVVAQSPEVEHHKTYAESLAYLCDVLGHVPAPFAACSTDNLQALNAGVLGGTDVHFLANYGKTALNLIKDNLSALQSKCELGTVNIILEQLLLFVLCQEQQKDVKYIIPTLSLDFSEVLNFHSVPILHTFIHLIGFAKKAPLACAQVEFRLKYEFPEEYERISLILDQELNLAKPLVVFHQDNKPDFARTRKVLRRLGAELAPVTPLLRKNFTSAIRSIGPRKHKAYLRDVYQLDMNLRESHRFTLADYWPYKHRAYQALEQRSEQYLLDCPLTLIPSARIIHSKWSLKSLNKFHPLRAASPVDANQDYYILTHKINQAAIVEEELSGWNQLLVYFYHNVISGQELIAELKDSVVSTHSELTNSILNFLLIEVIFTGRLILSKAE